MHFRLPKVGHVQGEECVSPAFQPHPAKSTLGTAFPHSHLTRYLLISESKVPQIASPQGLTAVPVVSFATDHQL